MPETNSDFALLAQAGISKEDIRRQLETLLHSETLEGMGSKKRLLAYLVDKSLAGKVPRVPEIAKAVFHRYVPGDSRVRKEAGGLRAHLAVHYAKHAKPSEIRFELPRGQYGVFAPKAAAGETQLPRPIAGAFARILDPGQDAEVYQRVMVRGRIDALHPDLRPWLVVETPVGDHYPQCWISKSNPEWENEVRIGLAGWGSNESAVYVIHLVAVTIEGDSAFYQYMKSGRDGFGPLLPSDCLLLDKKRVTRRDVRPPG